MLTRRHLIATAVAAPAILRFGTGTAHAATTLKISHQFPGGTIDKGDFRDRLCRMFAAEVAKRSKGDIAAEIYPNSSLIKTNAQFSAMRKGALDISLYPMPYAGGQGVDRLPRRQGHHPAHLGVAGRRRRQPLQTDRRP
jgi:TRAP-type C4-dicarboxylate transport system substrate-binding protein